MKSRKGASAMKNIFSHYPCHTLELNLMDCRRSRMRLSAGALCLLISPFLISGMILAGFILPEFEFLALCQNIPGGDVCSIGLR
jgi:hypothetical protein